MLPQIMRYYNFSTFRKLYFVRLLGSGEGYIRRSEFPVLRWAISGAVGSGVGSRVVFFFVDFYMARVVQNSTILNSNSELVGLRSVDFERPLCPTVSYHQESQS